MKNILRILFSVLLYISLSNAQDYSKIEQDGHSNLANVDQAYTGGNYNNSYILQDNGVGTSKTWIDQLGGGNLSDVHQTFGGNAPRNNNNMASVNQIGWDNNTQVYQKYDNEQINVYQEGWRNYSNSSQIGNMNEGVVEQIGNDNQSIINQDNNNNWAKVRQEQFLNYSIIDQTNGYRSKADIYSIGTSNYSSVTQNNWYNFADVDQVGTGNQSYITQYDGTNTPGVDNNTAKVYQVGNFHISNIMQDGITNSANVYQH